jgi:hypothetical protein
MTFISLSRVITFTLLLAACSARPVISPLPGPEHLGEDVSLASYHQWLARADLDTLQETRASFRQITDPSPVARLRHALLLSFDDNASSDALRSAARLLDDVLSQETRLPAGHADFSRLWKDMLTLRLELRETLARQAERIESLRQRNAEQARQIEALTIIEQQLNQRQQQEPES